MRVLLTLPIVLPLLAAGVSLALFRFPGLQRMLGSVVLVAVVGTSVAVLVQVEGGGVAVTQLGGWPAPIGITLVADLFSAIMLVVGAVMVLVVLVYAIGQPGNDDISPWFHPAYLVLTAGVCASFLTGDLFNLFVAFEVMLSASYVLITLGGTRAQVRSGMTYVVISIVASTFFVTAVALVYAATGTVNMADLAGRLADLPEGVRTALGLLLLVVFGVKAAIFPLFFWLPDSYPTAPSPVTAIFAGLLTKVGVYAIIRTQTLLFPTDGSSTLLLVLAGATMVVGVLGAIAQDDMKRILSFHIVSQIGYMIMGLGLFSIAGLAGAILYTVHHIVVKTSLFLVSGLVEHLAGTSLLRRLGGLARRAPLVGALFLLPALSLAGVPPFSGFVAKLALIQAGMAIHAWAIVGVSLLVSALTLFSMTKIWGGAFWGRPEGGDVDPDDASARLRAPQLMLGATSGLVVISLIIAVAAGPLFELTERAAGELLSPVAYTEAVLGR
ncbi:MAG TPA: Na+/H+ antiporter subunit D [Acidimicrobiales bacterium]|jgi:multicomponent Na+:H+ antiporter subunit D|nr:Na+/H+ antiporter subunit D [Acidimicrobiales bacterium]